MMHRGCATKFWMSLGLISWLPEQYWNTNRCKNARLAVRVYFENLLE